MLKFKPIYVSSLVVLGVLIAFTFFRPVTTGGDTYSEVQRTQLLESEGGWIIEFDIINHEGRDMSYTIEVTSDGEPYTESVSIRDGKMFTYIHHFYAERLTSNEVSFAVYKEGESAPVEEGTYFLQ